MHNQPVSGDTVLCVKNKQTKKHTKQFHPFGFSVAS